MADLAIYVVLVGDVLKLGRIVVVDNLRERSDDHIVGRPHKNRPRHSCSLFIHCRFMQHALVPSIAQPLQIRDNSLKRICIYISKVYDINTSNENILGSDRR